MPTSPPRPESFVIEVPHRDGVLTIPVGAEINFRAIFQVLGDQTTVHYMPHIHPNRAPLKERNQEVFGVGKVWVFETNAGLFVPRRNLTTALGMSGRGHRNCVDNRRREWSDTDVLRSDRPRTARPGFVDKRCKYDDSMPTPSVEFHDGVGKVEPCHQPDRPGDEAGKKARGKLRWAQITDVSFSPPRGHRRVHVRGRLERSIVRWVEGVPIEIVDLYSAATNEIHRRIMAYWSRVPATDSAEPRLLSQ